MSHADEIFIRNFLAVLGALVLFTIFAIFLASAIGSYTWERMQSGPNEVQQRIEPVAAVHVGEPGQEPPPPEEQKTQVAAAGGPEARAAAKSGEAVYNQSCAACHATGVAGAPKVDDASAWQERAQKGVDQLVSNAVDGIGAMPPKGGNASLSEAELERAVRHMLAQAGVESAGAAEAEPAQGAPAGGQEAAGEAAPSESQAAAGTEGQAGAASAAGKKVYDKTCATCHVTGVAGAPKLDDQAAWSQRADQGMDTLVEHAVNGFKAMPPKGGNMSLSEAQIRQAIQYMLEEAGVGAP